MSFGMVVPWQSSKEESKNMPNLHASCSRYSWCGASARLHCFLVPLFVLLLFYFIFESGFLCVTLAVLELTLYTRLASNSEIPPASVSRVVGLKVCATTTQWIDCISVGPKLESSEHLHWGIASIGVVRGKVYVWGRCGRARSRTRVGHPLECAVVAICPSHCVPSKALHPEGHCFVTNQFLRIASLSLEHQLPFQKSPEDCSSQYRDTQITLRCTGGWKIRICYLQILFCFLR